MLAMREVSSLEDVSKRAHREGLLFAACATLLPTGVICNMYFVGNPRMFEFFFPLQMAIWNYLMYGFRGTLSMLYLLVIGGHLCIVWQGIEIARGKGASSLVLHLLIIVTVFDTFVCFLSSHIGDMCIPMPLFLLIGLLTVTRWNTATMERLKEKGRSFQAVRDISVISIFVFAALFLPYAVLDRTTPAPLYGWGMRVTLYLTCAHSSRTWFQPRFEIGGVDHTMSLVFAALVLIIGIQYLLLSFSKSTVGVSFMIGLATLTMWMALGYLIYGSLSDWSVTPMPSIPLVGLLLMPVYLYKGRT